MRQPQDPTSSIRWLPFRSESSEPIPPFAVMRTTGFDDATGYYTVNQPNADSLSQVLINGASCVPALGEGQCHRTEPATVLYETNGGTPASDDDYGTQSGSWKLHAGKTGFRVLGVSTESNVAEFTFMGVNYEERGVTAEEVDGTPSYENTTTLRFDQADGFVLTQPSANVTRVDIQAATTTQAGVVSTSAQSYAGVKSFEAGSINVYRYNGTDYTGQVNLSAYGNATSNVWGYTYIDGETTEAALIAGNVYTLVNYARFTLLNNSTTTTYTFNPGSTGRDAILKVVNQGVTYTGQNGTDPCGNVFQSGLCSTVGTAPVTVPNGGTGVTSFTAYAVICGGTTSSGALQTVASVGTAGQVLTSNGAGALPSFEDAGDVTAGGTGTASFTAYAVVCGGTTSTGALQSVASVGTAGQVLTSNGAGALPTFQNAAGVSDGDKGDVVVSSSGTVWTVDAGVITFAKMQAVSANVLLGNDASGTTVEEITCTPFARTILDDTTAAAVRATIGAGTGTGNVTGPGSSTDNAIVRWNGTGGTAIQDSAVIINDDGTVEVNATVAATNTATTEILHLHTMSEGTPDDNFGSVIVIHLEDDTTEDVKASAQSTYWVDATHASRKSRWVLSTADAAGEREIMRGEASGSAPMIGFLGANAAIRQTGDVGTAMVTFGLMSGTPTFAWGNLSSVPTASDTASGIVELAVQSEMETATDTSRAVVPGRVQYHPGVCKGWVHFSATSGTVTSLASHNVSSITDGGVGNYTINWNTDFSGADYAVVGTASYLDGTATDVIVETHISFAAGSAQVYTLSYDAGTLVDTTRISIVAFGDQA